MTAASAVAAEEDRRWQKRRRVFSRLLLILFILRIAAAPTKQGYKTTLCALWEQCQMPAIPLPQDEPPAASSVCAAREKLDPRVFKRLHHHILAHSPADPLWKGHRIFAVDGSKYPLPRALIKNGYRTPNANAHYPQGLVRVLYRLRSRVPVAFDLFDHDNERAAARTHLNAVSEGDVIVYDRGYYSFALAKAHLDRKVHCVFRLKRNASADVDAFLAGSQTDARVTLRPPKAFPGDSPPLPLRLVKYTEGGTAYCLVTSLTDPRYRIAALSNLYRERWAVEEFYKTSKSLLQTLHSQSERGVRQELYANFVLITLTRIFTNRCDQDINAIKTEATEDDPSLRPPMRSNFPNALRLVGQEIEVLLLQHAHNVAAAIARIMTGVSRCLQRERPNRSYRRESRQPLSKWARKRRRDTAET